LRYTLSSHTADCKQGKRILSIWSLGKLIKCLVIFVDDLQWADSASLNLIQLLTTDADTNHLLIICAYRDNEVSPTQPNTVQLRAMQCLKQ